MQELLQKLKLNIVFWIEIKIHVDKYLPSMPRSVAIAIALILTDDSPYPDIATSATASVAVSVSIRRHFVVEWRQVDDDVVN